MITIMQTYHQVCHWKKFPDRLITEEVKRFDGLRFFDNPAVSFTNKTRTVLSQGKPHDVAVHFDTIEFYDGIVRFLCHITHFLLVFVCWLQKKWQVLERTSQMA